MSTESITDRVLRDVLNSDTLAPYCGDDAFVNAKRWRFLEGALAVLEERGMLADPADYRAPADPSLLDQDGDDDGCEAAPLDPKSVHVGDTVTVRFKETGDVLTTKAYQPDDVTRPGEWVYLLGWPLNKPMGHGLAVTKFEILAIEPAPKPEPGIHGTATVEGKVGVRGTWVRSINGENYFATHHAETSTGNLAHSDNVTDFVPDEPRPLPTRDELAEAITRGTATDFSGFNSVSGPAAADRVLDLLDGAR